MSADSLRCRELRPSGTISMGCQNCFLRETCGGLPNGDLFLTCFDQFCCGGKGCDHVCPYKPEDYQERMREIGGLRFDNVSELRQAPAQLPAYIPMVHHGSRRNKPLQSEVVALDPYKIFRRRGRRYSARTEDPIQLRRHFKVADDARVILRGTGKDRFLELYWEFRKTESVASRVAKLGIELFIGPNYSHFLDVPRPDLLFNRKRQLICLEELSNAGVSVAPNLSAITPADWDFWTGFLKGNQQLFHVAVNFQTGYRTHGEGIKAINRVLRMQDEIGRRLSLILIGGGQFTKYAAGRFESVTVIDSQPFKQTVYRQRFAPIGTKRSWDETWTLETQLLDDLFHENVTDYSKWIAAQIRSPHRRN